MTHPSLASPDPRRWAKGHRSPMAPFGRHQGWQGGGGLPAFVIVGAQRCGTTSLYRALTAHPAVLPAARKELQFFSKHFDRGADWYRAQFPATAPGQVSGEATPYYLFHPAVPARLAAVAPAARLIVLLRDPVERAYSHYHHEVRRGHETLPFEEALATEAERLAGEEARLLADDAYVSFNHQHFSYQARGRYADQLRRWLTVLPRERFLILASEAFYRDPAASLARVTAFLGLPPAEVAIGAPQNEGDYPPLRPETRAALTAAFRAPNAELAELLGEDFGWERDPAAT